MELCTEGSNFGNKQIRDQLNNQLLFLCPATPPSPRWAPCHSHLTCRDKQDARAENDVVAWLVELAGGDAQPSHEEQDHAQDGEDTGGPYSTWTHIEEKNDYHNYHPRTQAKNMTLELWNPIFTGKQVKTIRCWSPSLLLFWGWEQIFSFFPDCPPFLSISDISPPLCSQCPSPLLLSYQSVHQLSVCSPSACGWFADWPRARRDAAEPDVGSETANVKLLNF